MSNNIRVENKIYINLIIGNGQKWGIIVLK